jgi:hypothetical protein
MDKISLYLRGVLLHYANNSASLQDHHNFDRTRINHILCYLSLAYLQILVAISYQIYYAALEFQFNYILFPATKAFGFKGSPLP